MKVWSNRRHEEVLQLKKMKAQQAKDAREQAERERYDTRNTFNHNGKNEFSTQVIQNKRGW